MRRNSLEWADEIIDHALVSSDANIELPGGVTVEREAATTLLSHGFARAGRRVSLSTFPSALSNPLGPPTLSGTTYTIDWALQNPTRVTYTLMDLTLQKFFVDRVFASGGGVTGGAVIYDEVQANELYLLRDVQQVAPGTEFPIVTSRRRVPNIAIVEKWGGKFYITDEARDRNDVVEYTRQIRQLANTIVRKINQRGVEELERAVTAHSRTVGGNNWSTVVTVGSGATNAPGWPAFDFAHVQALADIEEMGQTIDLWILNPIDYLHLATVYGGTTVVRDLGGILAGLGISVFVTNRVAAGTAYAVAAKMVGEMRIEKPLGTETWRDARGTEMTWTQSSVRPLWFVNNPFAVFKVTGLGG